MAAFQAIFVLGHLHQLGAITTKIDKGSQLDPCQRHRLNLWMGLHQHRFIKCNFRGNWYRKESHRQ